MGAIQQSINSVLSSTAQLMGIGKAAHEMQQANELKKLEAKGQHIQEVMGIQKEYGQAKKEMGAVNKQYNQAKKVYGEAWSEFNNAENEGAAESAYDKIVRSQDTLEEKRDIKRVQQEAYRRRKQELQARLDIANEKASLYGIEPSTLKGGKK